MQNLPSQHTLLQWLKDIVHAAEDGNEMLPKWVMQEYREAQAEVCNKVKIEEKCGDGCDHQGPLTCCYSMSETTDDELFSFELVYVKVPRLTHCRKFKVGELTLIPGRKYPLFCHQGLVDGGGIYFLRHVFPAHQRCRGKCSHCRGQDKGQSNCP